VLERRALAAKQQSVSTCHGRRDA